MAVVGDPCYNGKRLHSKQLWCRLRTWIPYWTSRPVEDGNWNGRWKTSERISIRETSSTSLPVKRSGFRVFHTATDEKPRCRGQQPFSGVTFYGDPLRGSLWRDAKACELITLSNYVQARVEYTTWYTCVRCTRVYWNTINAIYRNKRGRRKWRCDRIPRFLIRALDTRPFTRRERRPVIVRTRLRSVRWEYRTDYSERLW